MQKSRIKKIFNFQWDIFRIQSDKTPIGLHGKGGKSNLSDRGPKDPYPIIKKGVAVLCRQLYTYASCSLFILYINFTEILLNRCYDMRKKKTLNGLKTCNTALYFMAIWILTMKLKIMIWNFDPLYVISSLLLLLLLCHRFFLLLLLLFCLYLLSELYFQYAKVHKIYIFLFILHVN